MSEKYFDRVEAYFEGKLSESERLVFEKAIKEDPGLMKAVEKYKLTKQAIDHLSDQEIRTKIKNWRTEDEFRNINKSKKETQIFRIVKQIPQRYKLIAAVILVLIVALPVFRLLNGTSNDDKVFASLSKPVEVDRMRSGESEAWLKGIEAYRDENSDLAIEYLSKVEPVDDQLRYYLAHSYYLVSDFESAEKLLKMIIELDESSFKEEAEWAWLACKYELNDMDASFDSLINNISLDENHSFHNIALEVLQKLESKK